VNVGQKKVRQKNIMKQVKVNWHQYFMDIAELASKRSSCDRKHVGAVIVKDRRVIATGYNGSLPDAQHCDEVGHMMEDGHCIRTIHAEINAIVQCAKYGVSCDSAVLYVNTFPCWHCFKTVVSAGIKHIYYKGDYPAQYKKRVYDMAKYLDIKLEKLEEGDAVHFEE
jgi:dCMP deaminase